MKNYCINFIALFVILVIIVLPINLKAQTFHFKDRESTSKEFLYGADIATGLSGTQTLAPVVSTFWTQHAPGPNSHDGKEIIKQSIGRIKLFIDHDNDAGVTTPEAWDDYTYRVLVDVTGYTSIGPNPQTVSFIDTLTISYKHATIEPYQDVHLKTYPGFYKMEVDVIDVLDWTCLYAVHPATPCPTPPIDGFLSTAPGSPAATSIAKNWGLKVDFVEQRVDKFVQDGTSWKQAYKASSSDIHTSSTAPTGNDNHLTVSWHVSSTQDIMSVLYELEWTYVDNYKEELTNGKVSGATATATPASLQYNFKDNSTRIITDKPEYKIPLIYKSGYLVYRVRVIMPDLDVPDNYKLWRYSDWSITADNGTIDPGLTNNVNYHTISETNAHMGDSYNWNYNVTYAEEGKSKSTVAYFDGLLKQRQTITKLNTEEDQTIVAQTYYNHEGKPALQTLPIPVDQDALKFKSDFAYPNGATNNWYKPSDIDPKQITTLTELDNNSDATKYYSSNNPFYTSGNQAKYLKAIPKAEGFPLIHTKFSPADGRVVEQSGIGPKMQLGGGHETNNYYMPATQFELDKYFGNDIGASAFYEKTVTKDPNAQLSFSIANNKGQTIMSGLMGYPTPGASPLVTPDGAQIATSGNADDFPDVDLLYGQTPLWVNGAKTFEFSRFMEKTGTVKLSHATTVNSYSPCTSASYHATVPLEYNIEVRNEYGQKVESRAFTLGDATYKISSSASSLSSNTVSNPIVANVVTGKNVVRYDVKYNPSHISAAVDDIVASMISSESSCLKGEEEFIDEHVQNIKLDCFEDEEDISMSSECTQYKEMMKDELYPMTKYGMYSTDENGNVKGTKGLFAPPNALTTYQYRYQEYAYNEKQATTDLALQNFYDGITKTSPEVFIKEFDDSYAEAFLSFHPEYCIYADIATMCDDDNGFIKQLERVNGEDLFEIANVLGIYDNNSTDPLSDLIAKDPMYDGGTASTKKLTKNELSTVKIHYPGGGSPTDERLDVVVFTRMFCAGGRGCREHVKNLSEGAILNDIKNASKEVRNEFVDGLISLYIANRRDKITRLKKSLMTSPCSTSSQYNTGALSDIDKEAPLIFDPLLIYDNASDDYPKYVGQSNQKFIIGENGLLTNDAGTSYDAISGKIFGNNNDVNGFTEYADQIVRKLINCVDVNDNELKTHSTLKTNLKDALVTFMNNATATGEARVWKGGLTPDKLKDILTSTQDVLPGTSYDFEFVLDDLCNPYLADYLQAPTNLVQEYTRPASFYDDLADFLYETFNESGICTTATHAQLRLEVTSSTSGNLSSGQTLNASFLTAHQNNSFFKEVVESLTGNPYSTSATIKVKALNGHFTNNNTNNSFTLFFYTGTTLNMSNCVSISLDMGPTSSLSWYNGPNSSGVMDMDWQNMRYMMTLSSQPGGGSFPIDFEFFSSTQMSTGRVVETKPSFVEGSLFIDVEIDFDDVPAAGQRMSGMVRGLKGGLDYANADDNIDQNLCITCIELKDAFDKQNATLASFKEDVMNEYGIKGIGHPYFEDVLASYMNFKFQRTHTAEEYVDFLEGCNLGAEYNIPQYYGYLHATSTTLADLDNITSKIQKWPTGSQDGKYKDFGHFYYYKEDVNNVVTEGNLYVDFNTFDRQDLREVKDYVLGLNSSATLHFNKLEDDVRSNTQTFADLFVQYNESAVDGTATCQSAVTDVTKNWLPKDGVYDKCHSESDFVTISNELVTVRHNGMDIPYRKFHFELAGTPSATSITEYLYWYDEYILPNGGAWSFIDQQQYFSTGTEKNVTDERKKDYLKYTYSKTAPANLQEKRELIDELQPDELRTNIDGTGVYGNDFDLFKYVSYKDQWKDVASGDLFIQTSDPSSGYGINIVRDIITAGAQGAQYFSDQATSSFSYNGGTNNVTVKRLPNNVLWYKYSYTTTTNGKTTNHEKNFMLKFPDYLPFKVDANTTFDISSFEVVKDPNSTPANQPKIAVAASRGKQGYFTVEIHKTSTNNSPSGKTFPSITIKGQADFELANAGATSNYTVYENVMLCSDAAHDNGDDFDFLLCYKDKLDRATQLGMMDYDAYIEAKKKEFRDDFALHIKAELENDQLSMKAPQASYLMTLYGYDRAGNLHYTIPPEGVKPLWSDDHQAPQGLSSSGVMLAGCKDFRDGSSSTSIAPEHHKQTKYFYNAQNKLVTQSTVDAGETRFFYDEVGRLIASQNAQQQADERIAYTLYDYQNRIIETGQVYTLAMMKALTDKLFNNEKVYYSEFKNTVESVDREQVIHTFYDNELVDLSTKPGMSKQDFLRSRPVTIARYEHLSSIQEPGDNFDIAIHYSYDISGNVKTLTYDMVDLEDVKQRYKRIDYDYDLYSGKVRLVSFNRGYEDQYYQRYSYDADNRITRVETSKDGLLWDEDAVYKYYRHGPLASVGLGHLKVQKLDFVYTLQGWLKSINGDTPNEDNDYGGDGPTHNSSYQIDLVRSTLYYHKDDFKSADPRDYTNTAGSSMTKIPDLEESKSLYNGNISAAVTIPANFPSLYTNYTYDQLNRIKEATYKLPDYTATSPSSVLQSFSSVAGSGAVLHGQSISADDVYKTTFSYDRDGNLKTLTRNALYTSDPTDYSSAKAYQMDDLAYHYDRKLNGAQTEDRNRLVNFEDFSVNHNAGGGQTSNFDNDLQPYTTADPHGVPRMTYYEDGNLASDAANAISQIDWNMYGKVTKVTSERPGEWHEFAYDPLNNRFRKSIVKEDGLSRKNEYYIRDASGNVLAIYRQNKKYKVEKAHIDILTGYTNLTNTQLAEDMSNGMGNLASFSNALVTNAINADMPGMEMMANSKDVSFYMAANHQVKNALLDETPEVVDDLVNNNLTIVTTPLYATYERDFFMPMLCDTCDTTRRILIGNTVGSGDTATMMAIVTTLYPNAEMDVQTLDDYIDIIEYARTDKPNYDVIHDAMAQHLTGTKLQTAVDNLMANADFMTQEYPNPVYVSTEKYLKQMLKDKGNMSDLQTYYDNRVDGRDLLYQVAPLHTQLEMLYGDDKEAFIEEVLNMGEGRITVGEAINNMGNVSAETMVGRLVDYSGTATTRPTYEATNYIQVLDEHKTWLAEHTLYGSDRLGIKTYFPSTVSFEWDPFGTHKDNMTNLNFSSLTRRKPWYFYNYNGLIKPLPSSGVAQIVPWGNAYGENHSANRVLGMKRYEMSNHLGNVLAVTTDKITHEVAQAGSMPKPYTEKPSLYAAYDYYPFGMLMPMRTYTNEEEQCAIVTRTMHLKKRVKIRQYGNDPGDVAVFTPLNGGTTVSYAEMPDRLLIDGDAIDAPHAEMELTGTTLANGDEFEFEGDITNVSGGNPITVQLIQDDGTKDVILASTTVATTEFVTLTGLSVGTLNARVEFVGTDPNSTIEMKNVVWHTIDITQDDILVKECDGTDFDQDYRYGFNGQEKDNKIAGIGNSMTAMFWQYDSRLGRRWNLDPVDQISISNYAVMGLNPINKVDPLGNTPDNIYVNDKDKTYSVQGTDDPYDRVIKSGYDEDGNYTLTPQTVNGVEKYYKPGTYQDQLNSEGYRELRGAQSEQFAGEMVLLEGAGKVVGKGLSWAWKKTVGNTIIKYSSKTSVSLATSESIAAQTSTLSFKPFTRSYYRHNLQVLTGQSGKGMDAHHIFPQAKRFKAFWDRVGININHPSNMRWWKSGPHRKAAYEYNQAWDDFIFANPNATRQQVENFGKELMESYGH